MPRVHDYTAPHFQTMEAKIVELFVNEQEFTYQRVADMVAPPDADGNRTTGNGTARDRLKAMAHAGFIEERDNGMRRRPHAFNRSDLPMDGGAATLRDPVSVYLADPEVSATQKDALAAAIRFGVRNGSTRLAARGNEALLQWCESVSIGEIQQLMQRVRSTAISDQNRGEEISDKTLSNHLSALRAFLRYAATKRLVPLIFSITTGNGAWEAVKARFFAERDESGMLTGDARYYRTAWNTFYRRVTASTDRKLHPEELTIAQIEGVFDKARREGRLSESDRMRQCWRRLTQLGYGPYANSRAVAPHPATRIVLPDGTAPNDWTEFVRALRHVGFDDEFVQFFEWYRTYTTAHHRDLKRRKDEFPKRREGRDLTQSSVRSHVQGLRTWLGIALDSLDIAGPHELTLDRAFGTDSEAISDLIVAWWEARAIKGEVSGRYSSGLKSILVPAAMVALGRYEQLKHARRQGVATRTTPKGKVVLDTREEEAAGKSIIEENLYSSYRTILTEVNSLASDAATSSTQQAKGTTGRSVNTMIDLLDLMRAVPPEWWEAVLAELIRQARHGLHQGLDDETFHVLITDTVLLGTYISTGCRAEEPTHARLGVQARHLRTERRIQLRPIDRKNRRAHTVIVHAEYVPDDIFECYLDRSRPFFMRRLEGGATAHDWLFVRRNGLPFGCEEESPDGNGRDELSHDSRINALRSRFKNRIASAAFAIGLTIPTDWGYLGMHAIRRVFGFGLFVVSQSVIETANYLGDELSTVMDTYGTISGEFTNVASLRGVRLFKRVGISTSSSGDVAEPSGKRGTNSASQISASTVAPSDSGRDGAGQILGLVQARRDGWLSPDEFEKAKRLLDTA